MARSKNRRRPEQRPPTAPQPLPDGHVLLRVVALNLRPDNVTPPVALTGGPDGRLTSPPTDSVTEKKFVESCNMYRHFYVTKYYIFAVAGIFTGGLLAGYINKDSDFRVKNLIVLLGIAVALVAVLFDFAVTRLIKYYHELMIRYAERLGHEDKPFSDLPYWRTWNWVALACTTVLYIIGMVCWSLIFHWPAPSTRALVLPTWWC
jgi:hypothetical protein